MLDEKLSHLGDLSAEKRALLARQLRAPNGSAHLLMSDPIAIIGIGCRLPGHVRTPEAFWDLLRDGVDAIGEVPADRWSTAAFYDPDPDAPGKMSTRWGGFLDHCDRFDHGFFGISPREARQMDPQQRIFLEVAWEALEHAGQPVDALAGSATGVFAGIFGSDYSLIQNNRYDELDIYSCTGNAPNILAGRLSYLLDLRGPSVAIDTACSSSLLAVHLACQSLRTGECRMALAGGVNIIISPHMSITTSKMRMMAPDGHCKTFDERANGYVRGEGCGVVVLKRFADALADNDPILALIRGSAANQDGRSASITAPNLLAQQALLREALANAGVSPASIGYVETHGTGTALGDPIEVQALTAVLGQPRPDDLPCFLGALKTNIGHLEAAAGIAGLIKVVLALRHAAIPPNLNFQTLNPHISLNQTPFVLPTTLQPWPAGSGRRYAGVNSFGWSGTNVHVVLEEAPPSGSAARAPQPGDQPVVLTVSARSGAALTALAESYQALLAQPDAPAVRDLTYTAGARRSHHAHRLAAVGRSAAELADQLGAWLAGEERPGLSADHHSTEAPQVVFVCPGHGSQWLGMARDLLADQPVFQQAIMQADAAFRPYADWSLLELLTGDDDTWINRTDCVQPALCAISLGLAALWRSWGVTPTAVVGHSMGEVAAACIAGALSLDDAARVICNRSRLMRRVSGQGAMAVVDLTLDEARAALAGYDGRLVVAVSNSSRSTVISGATEALDALLPELEARGVFCRRVKVDVASHSPQMDPLLPELRQLLAAIRPQTASIPFYSTVERRLLEGPELDADYWVRNLREPVYFCSAVQELARQGRTVFVELSPHPLLLPAIADELRTQGLAGATLPSLRRETDWAIVLLGSLGGLFTQGYPVEWARLYPQGGRVVRLPGYPWQHEQHWIDAAPATTHGAALGRPAERGGHPLLGQALELAGAPETRHWEQVISTARLPYLADHQVQELIVLPGAAYAELGLAAARQVWDTATCRLNDLRFQKLLSLRPDEQRVLQVRWQASGDGRATFQVFSRVADDLAAWEEHASGTLARASATAADPVDRAALAACSTSVAADDYYVQLAARAELRPGVPRHQGFECRRWRGAGGSVPADGGAGRRGVISAPPRAA